jgi:hypothetical protein
VGSKPHKAGSCVTAAFDERSSSRWSTRSRILAWAHGLKRCSYGWDLFYRNSGRVECTNAGIGETTIVLSDAPAAATTPSYLRAIASAFEGFVLGLGGHAAKAKILQDEHIEFSIRWSVAKA